MIKILFGIVLIAAASVGATVFYMGGKLSFAQPDTQPPALPGPVFVALDPFTVTLHDQDSSNILYVAVTLRVADERSRHLLDAYMPEVRNRVLLDLSLQNPEVVQTSEGRTQLASSLAKALEAPYFPEPKGPSITSVLFTAFVVQ